MTGSQELFQKLLCNYHPYFNNYDNSVLPFPCRCLYHISSALDVLLSCVSMMPEEWLDMLSCFWCFKDVKTASVGT